MAWPRREVWLAAEQTADADALAAWLRGRGVQVVQVPANAEPVWPQAGEPETGPTETVCWPGVEPGWWPEASQRGVERFSLPDFLHILWRGEVILPVPEPVAMFDGRPLLWHLLQRAGFAPALLWPGESNDWVIDEVGNPWCRIIPAAWLATAGVGREIGRQPVSSEGNVTAIWRDNTVDYYREDLFVGSLPRRPDQNTEQAVHAGAEWALRLGVSWFDIFSTFNSLGIISSYPQERLGWNRNDFGWNAGPEREELSVEPVDFLADRWAG